MANVSAEIKCGSVLLLKVVSVDESSGMEECACGAIRGGTSVSMMSRNVVDDVSCIEAQMRGCIRH